MRYIPVHEVFNKLNREQRNIMLAVYCLTGCDTTSSFLGHGKRTAFRVMMQKATKLQALANLGSGSLTKVEQEACVQFVGFLYGAQDCVSLNQLRAEKASKNIGPKKLPPTEDSMHQHMLRCVYQLSIWHQDVVALQQLQDVLQFGYERDTITNKLQPTMMTQPNAAPELLNEIVCVCAPNRCHDQCICLKSEQPCTAACSCQAELPYQDDVDGICTNPLTMAALYHHDSDSDIE